jgi:hypothetical protein
MSAAIEAASQLRYRQHEGEEGLPGWDDEARKMLDELIAWLDALPRKVEQGMGRAVKGVKTRVRWIWQTLCVGAGCVPRWPV